jgi:hypothetical protein
MDEDEFHMRLIEKHHRAELIAKRRRNDLMQEGVGPKSLPKDSGKPVKPNKRVKARKRKKKPVTPKPLPAVTVPVPLPSVTLTYANLHALGTNGCGFNRKQLALLDVAWPPKSGWLKRKIGTKITETLYNQLLALKREVAPKPKQAELFLFEELHPVTTQPEGRWPVCKECGQPTYANPDAPQSDLCPEHWFAYLDSKPK